MTTDGSGIEHGLEALQRRRAPARPDGTVIFQPSGDGLLITRITPDGRSEAAWLQGADAEAARQAWTVLTRLTAGVFPVKPPPD